MGWSENAGLTQHFPKMFFASKRGCYSNSRFIAVTGAQLLPPSKYDWEFLNAAGSKVLRDKWYLVPPESTRQTAPQSVQPFLYGFVSHGCDQ